MQISKFRLIPDQFLQLVQPFGVADLMIQTVLFNAQHCLRKGFFLFFITQGLFQTGVNRAATSR